MYMKPSGNSGVLHSFTCKAGTFTDYVLISPTDVHTYKLWYEISGDSGQGASGFTTTLRFRHTAGGCQDG